MYTKEEDYDFMRRSIVGDTGYAGTIAYCFEHEDWSALATMFEGLSETAKRLDKNQYPRHTYAETQSHQKEKGVHR